MIVDRIVRVGLLVLVRILVGAHSSWQGCSPSSKQRIYFSNHTSHLDTLAIWTALSRGHRRQTRPVAAKDYWGKGLIKSFIANKVLNAVLIDRELASRRDNPLTPLLAALQEGDSLILFPEGTRKAQALPDDFKSGLYALSKAMPHVELVPVYLDTLHRSMPKGSILLVPLVCTVRFGAPLQHIPDEPKKAFLARAKDAVVALAN